MLVAAAAHRARGLLYYRLAKDAAVVNASIIQQAIVPAIAALAREYSALVTPSAELPIKCSLVAVAEGAGSNLSARLVARSQVIT